MISGDQIRAARALLRLDQRGVAQRAHVSAATLRRVESGTARPKASARAVAAIQRALEAAGAEFIENGVRRRPAVQEEKENLMRDLLVIARRSAKLHSMSPGGFSEDELYDENGLPR